MVYTMQHQWGFPLVFGIIMIFASLKGAGQYSSPTIALYKCRGVCSPSGGISCIIRAVLRSEPGALCGFSCLITCLISLRVKECRFPEGWVFVASFLRTSGSQVLS